MFSFEFDSHDFVVVQKINTNIYDVYDCGGTKSIRDYSEHRIDDDVLSEVVAVLVIATI